MSERTTLVGVNEVVTRDAPAVAQLQAALRQPFAEAQRSFARLLFQVAACSFSWRHRFNRT
jgi:hypothetical protein